MRRHLDRTLDTLKGMAPTTPPPETCPLIDRIIKRVEEVRHGVGEIRLNAMNTDRPLDGPQLGKDLGIEAQPLDAIADSMEELRHHNARLRNLSLYWYQVAKQLHTEGNAKSE